MKRFGYLVPTLALALALSACGLIPPIPVTDPLHLDGEQVTLEVGASGSSLAVQAVPAAGGTSAPVQFNDQDFGAPRAPSSLRVDGGFKPTATVMASSYPETLTLSNIQLTVRLWDGAQSFEAANTNRRAEVTASYDGNLTLSRSEACSDFAESCEYTFTNTDLLQGSLRLELTGATLSRALDIIENAPQPNYVEALVTLQVAGNPNDPLPGTEIMLELDMADGQITVF
jgi:hypothetical protein